MMVSVFARGKLRDCCSLFETLFVIVDAAVAVLRLAFVLLLLVVVAGSHHHFAMKTKGFCCCC